MFQINGVYANRKGKYTVLALDPPKMSVLFEDGTEALLNMDIQERIWENILAESEAQKSSRASRAKRKEGRGDIQFFVKSVSMVAQEEISAPTWRDKVTMVINPGPELVLGSRIIYYDMETRNFFAVATVTGESSKKPPKGFSYPGRDAANFTFYPIDMDVSISNMQHALSDDSVELESQPDYRVQIARPESHLPISEDDFELLAELLTEVIEIEEDEDDDIDEDDDEFEG